MKVIERANMVKSMDTIIRSLNDEDIIDSWLAIGVADGDINENTTDEDLSCYYESDTGFADLMATFVRLIHRAYKDGNTENGVLYCDSVISRRSE